MDDKKGGLVLKLKPGLIVALDDSKGRIAELCVENCTKTRGGLQMRFLAPGVSITRNDAKSKLKHPSLKLR